MRATVAVVVVGEVIVIDVVAVPFVVVAAAV